MSMELMDEHEQGERVRAWLRDNGASIITGIALGIAGIAGWQWWQHKTETHRFTASAQYLELGKSVEGKDRDGAEAIVTALRTQYGDTPYATLAALQWSELQVEAGELQGAIATLRDAVKASDDPTLIELARGRLARALLATGEAQAVLDTLATPERGTEFELRGDALLLLDRRDEAIAAYQKALDSYEASLPTRRQVEMKLLDLGVKNDAVEA